MGATALLGVIFDLDGVIVSTDDCHYLAWKRMADEEGIPFDRTVNERLRGVSRGESLAIILEKAGRAYSEAEKTDMAARKNAYYIEYISCLTAEQILPGALHAIRFFRARGLKIAIGSSSRNTPLLLRQIGLHDMFDAVADGNRIAKSKPDPEVFLLAARLMGVAPESCLVVEDADAGIEAAIAGGMRSLGVGYAADNERATYCAKSLAEVDIGALLADCERE